MIEMTSGWFHFMAEIAHLINPILMVFACCMWILLYLKVRKELDRAYIRTYSLERQIDYLINRNNVDIDKEFFTFMRKTYKELE